MTALDPLQLLREDRDKPWRPIPGPYLLRWVSGLGLRPADELLFWKLWAVCDDAGAFIAVPRMLAGRLNAPTARPAKALERLAAARLIELYEVEAVSYGRIRGYSELVKLTHAASPIHPAPIEVGEVVEGGGGDRPPEGTPDGTPEGTPDGASPSLPSLLSPPTPPPIIPPCPPPRSGASGARAPAYAREELEAVAAQALLTRPTVAAKKHRAPRPPKLDRPVALSDAPKPRPPEEPMPTFPPPVGPLPAALEEVAQAWLVLHERVKPELKPSAQKIPAQLVRDEIRRLAERYGVQALRDACKRLANETAMEGGKWWGDPLANLERKTQWAWRDLPDRVRDRTPAGRAELGETQVDPPKTQVDPPKTQVDPPKALPELPRPEPSDELVEVWAVALERLRAEVEPWDLRHWIQPIVAQGLRGDVAVLGVPDESHASWVLEHWGSRIDEAMRRAGGGHWSVCYEPYT